MDYIINATNDNKEVSLYVAKTTDMVETMRKYHNPTPVVSAAIGRSMTATSILGLSLKGEKNKITTIIKGTGDIGNITCVSDSTGNVKACATNYYVDIPLRESDGKLDVSTAVGKDGILTVIKDLGLKEPYVGHNKLFNGEIAQDYNAYLLESEQLASSVGLGVLVGEDYTINHAGGFIVSLMPFTSEETIATLEDNIKNIRSVTSMMSEGKTPEDIASIILKGLGCNILSTKEVKYNCDCSRQRMKTALETIGKDELIDIKQKDHRLEICCHFCDKKYLFDETQIDEILQNIC
jgi:hsp33 protein